MKLLEKYPEIKVIHVLGTPNQEEMLKLNETDFKNELKTYCDMVQFDFIDSYLNITLDTTSILKFALSWENLNLDYLVIADDDTYINLPELINTLYKSPTIITKVGYCIIVWCVNN